VLRTIGETPNPFDKSHPLHSRKLTKSGQQIIVKLASIFVFIGYSPSAFGASAFLICEKFYLWFEKLVFLIKKTFSGLFKIVGFKQVKKLKNPYF